MKRYILSLWVLLAMATGAMAQSTMTDQQVMEFYLEQRQQGVSQQQIVTKLMQRGVNIQQLQRIRKKYEQQQNNSGLGAVNITTDPKAERLRQNNAAPKDDAEGVTLLAEACRNLSKEIGLETNFKGMGLDEQEFLSKIEEVAVLAYEDQCSPANPRVPLVEDMKVILKKAYYGE